MRHLYDHYLSVINDNLSEHDEMDYSEVHAMVSKQNHNLYGTSVVLREYVDMKKKFDDIVSNSSDSSDYFAEEYRNNTHFACFRVLETSNGKAKVGMMTRRINHNNDWLFHYNSSKKNVIEVDTKLTYPHGSVENYVSMMLVGNNIKTNDVFVWLFIFGEMFINPKFGFSIPTIIFNLGDIYRGVDGQGLINMKKFIFEKEQKFSG